MELVHWSQGGPGTDCTDVVHGLGSMIVRLTMDLVHGLRDGPGTGSMVNGPWVTRWSRDWLHRGGPWAWSTGINFVYEFSQGAFHKAHTKKGKDLQRNLYRIQPFLKH